MGLLTSKNLDGPSHFLSELWSLEKTAEYFYFRQGGTNDSYTVLNDIHAQVNEIHNPFGWSCDRVIPQGLASITGRSLNCFYRGAGIEATRLSHAHFTVLIMAAPGHTHRMGEQHFALWTRTLCAMSSNPWFVKNLSSI